jgi:hypothetical protein
MYVHHCHLKKKLESPRCQSSIFGDPPKSWPPIFLYKFLFSKFERVSRILCDRNRQFQILISEFRLLSNFVLDLGLTLMGLALVSFLLLFNFNLVTFLPAGVVHGF